MSVSLLINPALAESGRADNSITLIERICLRSFRVSCLWEGVLPEIQTTPVRFRSQKRRRFFPFSALFGEKNLIGEWIKSEIQPFLNDRQL